MLDKYEEQRKRDQQSLYREREVQNLRDMIYGAIDSDATTSGETFDDSLIVDTNRYDVHPSKLELYTDPDMKKLLKSKFVTGQSQDQIMKNLLNMSDSDEEEEAADRKIKKLKKQTKKDDEESEGDSDEEEPAIVNRGKKIQKDSEDIRKDREKEKKRREDNE
jgi:hypothetical protein